jgi:hypothetical protein
MQPDGTLVMYLDDAFNPVASLAEATLVKLIRPNGEVVFASRRA